MKTMVVILDERGKPYINRSTFYEVSFPLKEAVQHSQEDGPLVLYGQEVGMVKIVGQV